MHFSLECFSSKTYFLGCIAWSAAFCSSRPWMENFTMLRFILSHASIERRSVIRFSTSFGSSVGIAMPGSGTPREPHRLRYISNGSCGGRDPESAMGVAFSFIEELPDLGLARHRVLVAEVDQRAAERLLEQEVARKIGARAVQG